MGTNFYRIPKEEEFNELKRKVLEAVSNTSDFHLISNIECTLKEIIDYDWKDEEGNKARVHLGKRSAGWKFLWNFHRNKFYSNKEELLKFIREGRVFDEYGSELNPDEFIEMALNWCPEGYDSFNPAPCYNFNTGELIQKTHSFYSPHDTYIDGLRISTPQQNSTYFS